MNTIHAAAVHAAGALGGPLSAVDPTFDFSGTLSLIAAFAAALVLAVLAVFGSAMTVAASIWGFPKLIGLFKKTAK